MTIVDIDALLQEIDAAAPCGPDLEYDPDFLALEQAVLGKPEDHVSGIAAKKISDDARSTGVAEQKGREEAKTMALSEQKARGEAKALELASAAAKAKPRAKADPQALFEQAQRAEKEGRAR